MLGLCRLLRQFCSFLRAARIALREIKKFLLALPEVLHSFLAVMVEIALTLLAGFGLWQLLVHH
jgi:hypothetical protein